MKTLSAPINSPRPTTVFTSIKYPGLSCVFLFSVLLLQVAWADTLPLQNKKQALQIEYNLVKQTPETYYILIDLKAQEAYLKADANLLRTCKIKGVFGTIPNITQKLTLQKHLFPHTSTISPKRLLPLDFVGRLTKGPKHRSRLYFMPSFILQSVDLPTPKNLSGILLENHDIKALASALVPQNNAILLPLSTP